MPPPSSFHRSSTTADEWLIRALHEYSPARFADEFAAAVEDGVFQEGVRLPTIRVLAERSDLSFRAINESWKVLRERGLIETRRRGGTLVASRAQSLQFKLPQGSDGHRLDFHDSNADPAFIPSISRALMHGLGSPNLNSFATEDVTASLRDAALSTMDADGREVTAGNNASESLIVAVTALTPQAGTIAIDQPANPGLLTTLSRRGFTLIGVMADEAGPDPVALEYALQEGAATYLMQPAQPYGIRGGFADARVGQLADVLEAYPEVAVIEDDPVGPLATSTIPTLVPRLPSRVVRVRSFDRIYGVDLRAALSVGPSAMVETIRDIRREARTIPSRIFQDALAFLLSDRETTQSLHLAGRVYARRRRALIDALHSRGMVATSSENGQFVWVEVPDELDAVVSLASVGITVGAGSRSFITRPDRPLIRIASMRLGDDEGFIQEFAERVSDAVMDRLRRDLH